MANEIFIDMTKAMHEADRMAAGEIAYNSDYLKELIELPDGEDIDFDFDLQLTCADCGNTPVWVNCPECKILQSPDCGLCEGNGGFWECFRCNDASEEVTV